MEQKRFQGFGVGAILLIAGLLLLCMSAAVFIPVKACWCTRYPSQLTPPAGSWRCPQCQGKGKVSLYSAWRTRRSPTLSN